jgi:hypothetical protein
VIVQPGIIVKGTVAVAEGFPAILLQQRQRKVRGRGELPPALQGDQVPVVVIRSQLLPRIVGAGIGIGGNSCQHRFLASLKGSNTGSGITSATGWSSPGSAAPRSAAGSAAGPVSGCGPSWARRTAPDPRGHLAVRPGAGITARPGGAGVRAGQQCRHGIGEFFLGCAVKAAADMVPGQFTERNRHPVQVLPEGGHPSAGRVADPDPRHVEVPGFVAHLILCDQQCYVPAL